ncbi:MAG TPA: GAF domain-containing protein, partial [Terriglobales bacterium]|nr:GAF domain-containing protein [Terriglobales bacterium]
MKPEDNQFGSMLHALQERAKELNCLYQVGELLSHPERPLDEILRSIIEILPPGWQFPHDCQARVIFEGRLIQNADYCPTPWVQNANIVVQGETLGSIEVSYRNEMPRSDEGPFLKEERKLIDTIAERIASAITQRRLKAAFETWTAADTSPAKHGEWRVVLEFLRDTDPALLRRISRKLINYLSWSGIPEAKELLQRRSAMPPEQRGVTLDENRPLPADVEANHFDVTKVAF